MTGETASTNKTHPLIIVAAGAVTLLCAAAIASIMGDKVKNLEDPSDYQKAGVAEEELRIGLVP